jgi:hypothetical protein
MQSTDSETPPRSAADTILSLGSSRATVLTAVEATLRLNRDGPNDAPEERVHPLSRFLRKFWGLSAWMLELIVALSFMRGKRVDRARTLVGQRRPQFSPRAACVRRRVSASPPLAGHRACAPGWFLDAASCPRARRGRGGAHSRRRLRPRRYPDPRRRRARRVGWEFLHVAIDDATRLAYVEVLAAQDAPTCAAFLRRAVRWYGRCGLRIRRLLTDNGFA